MDNLSAMSGIERSCDLAHDCHGPRRIQQLVGQDLLQIGAVDKLHAKLTATSSFPRTGETVHHVRLPQPPGGTRLPESRPPNT